MSRVGGFLVLLLLLGAFCRPVAAQARTYDFDFRQQDFGWTAGFADYPPGEEEFYELTADYRPLPRNLGEDKALYISGANHSDDLFMYYKKQIDGLLPNTTYRTTFLIEFASKYPDGSFGIGGSPANSVYLKAGATVVEPEGIIEDDRVRMNIDKGNQSSGGSDGLVLGDVAKPDDGSFTRYVLVERDNSDELFTVQSDAEGQLWLWFGTDSGFEGTTSLYYTQLAVRFAPAVPGDFDGDGQLTAADIDRLNEVVRTGDTNLNFDLNENGTVDAEDRRIWVQDVRGTTFGDANLDGRFDSRDLVAVFQAGQYEDGVEANAGWATGDWNGDQEFSSGDLVMAFQAGGYEAGGEAAHAVPEPAGSMLALIALAGLAWRASRRT